MEPTTDSESGIELAPGVRATPASLRFQFSRSSGPGGQNVNKVNTRAELWLDLLGVTGLSPAAIQRLKLAAGKKMTAAGLLHLACDSERTAEGNRQGALGRLREMIVQAQVEPRRRRRTRPTRGSKLQRLDSKRRRSQTKSHRRSSPEE